MAEELTHTSGPDKVAVAATSAPPARPPGYELLDEIGRGGMGVVYRARDVALRACGRPPGARRPGPPCRRPAGHKLSLEPLEDRTVPSGNGLALSLLRLGGATPTPIPLPPQYVALDGADIGGPAVYLNAPGPATAPPVLGNDNSAITDFRGVYGGAALVGTGFDGQGVEGWWAADVRFMQGTYRGVNGKFYHGTFVEV